MKSNYIANIKSLSIAPIVKEDPRQLLYFAADKILRNKHNLVRYVKLYQSFSEANEIKQLETFAHSNNSLVVPVTFFSWRRRKTFEHLRVKVGKNHYFLIDKDLLKADEFYKYMGLVHLTALKNDLIESNNENKVNNIVHL